MIRKVEYQAMYDLIGAAMEVYNEMGRGLEEPLYQEAMAMELEARGIPYEREKVLKAYYKGVKMKKTYVADFYSQDIIIEFKSVLKITQEHRAQLFNYLRLTRLNMGVLINFGEDHFHAERYVYNREDDHYELITKQNLHMLVSIQ